MEITRRQFLTLAAAGAVVGFATTLPGDPLPRLEPNTWYHLFAFVPEGGYLPIPRMDTLDRYELSRDTKIEGLRRIGAVLTNEHGDIMPFEMKDGPFTWA